MRAVRNRLLVTSTTIISLIVHLVVAATHGAGRVNGSGLAKASERGLVLICTAHGEIAIPADALGLPAPADEPGTPSEPCPICLSLSGSPLAPTAHVDPFAHGGRRLSALSMPVRGEPGGRSPAAASLPPIRGPPLPPEATVA